MDKKELYKKVEDLDLFCLGIRKYVALNEVMYLVKQLDEPQKVLIPQFVADWITYCKDMGYTLKYAIYFPKEAENEEVYEWVNESLNNTDWKYIDNHTGGTKPVSIRLCLDCKTLFIDDRNW